MQLKQSTVLVAALAAAVVASPLTAATLVGNITADYIYPTAGTVYATTTFSAGSTVVCPDAGACSPFVEAGTLWGSGSAVGVTEDAGSGYNSASFNGMQFTGLTFNNGSHIIGFTLDTDLAGLTAANIDFGANWISYNAQGLSFADAPYHVTLKLLTSDAPEPASWAMMLGGFGAIGGALRSRRKSSVSFA